MIEENLKRKQILTCIVEETYLFTQHREVENSVKSLCL